jgi:tRNA (Thr-GGU) A37 N-methylase
MLAQPLPSGAARRTFGYMTSYTLERVSFIRSIGTGRCAAAGSGRVRRTLGSKSNRDSEALLGMEGGHELMVITSMHDASRNVLKNRPRGMRAVQ